MDIGCGTGSFSEAACLVAPWLQSVTALDPSAEMVRIATETVRNQSMQAIGMAGLLGDDLDGSPSFEGLLAAHVIGHTPDITVARQVMRKLAAPKSKLWLVVSKPHWCNVIIWLQWRHRAYRPTEVARALEASDWKLDAAFAFAKGPPSRTSKGYLATAI